MRKVDHSGVSCHFCQCESKDRCSQSQHCQRDPASLVPLKSTRGCSAAIYKHTETKHTFYTPQSTRPIAHCYTILLPFLFFPYDEKKSSTLKNNKKCL